MLKKFESFRSQETDALLKLLKSIGVLDVKGGYWRLRMKEKLGLRLWLYRWIYAPLASCLDDYKHRNDPPLPPIPCQLCGQTGHKEKFCPNAKRLGY